MKHFIGTSLALSVVAAVLTGCNDSENLNIIEENVRYQGGDPNTQLAATLSLPAQRTAPYPGIVLITGSGPQDRDETIGELKPFKVLANALNQAGYAVLRHDDRGTAQSSGDFATATLDDFAADTVASVNFLKSDARIAADCTILIGHSEGGYIAPIAAQTTSINAMVILAGAAQPMTGIVLTQLLTLQFPDQDPALVTSLFTTINRIVAESRDFSNTARELDAILEQAGLDAAERAPWVSLFASPWWQRYLSFEPAEYLNTLAMPVLSLYGEKDVQVRAADNADLMQSYLHHPHSSVAILSGMNHLFQYSDTGLPDEYFTLPSVFEADMIQHVLAWLDTALPQQCKPQP